MRIQVPDGILALGDQLRNQAGQQISYIRSAVPSYFLSFVQVERIIAPSLLTMTIPCTFLCVCMRLRVYSTSDILYYQSLKSQFKQAKCPNYNSQCFCLFLAGYLAICNNFDIQTLRKPSLELEIFNEPDSSSQLYCLIYRFAGKNIFKVVICTQSLIIFQTIKFQAEGPFEIVEWHLDNLVFIKSKQISSVRPNTLQSAEESTLGTFCPHEPHQPRCCCYSSRPQILTSMSAKQCEWHLQSTCQLCISSPGRSSHFWSSCRWLLPSSYNRRPMGQSESSGVHLHHSLQSKLTHQKVCILQPGSFPGLAQKFICREWVLRPAQNISHNSFELVCVLFATTTQNLDQDQHKLLRYDCR